MERVLFVALLAVTLSVPVFAQNTTDHAAHHPDAADSANLTTGEVRKIDKAQGKVTLAHEPIQNLGMAKMTMVFRVRDPAMLDQVKPGDKVRFAAEKIEGKYTVTRWERAK